MFGFGSWKQLLAGREYCRGIGHHNVGAFGSQKAKGLGLGNDHGVVNSRA